MRKHQQKAVRWELLLLTSRYAAGMVLRRQEAKKHMQVVHNNMVAVSAMLGQYSWQMKQTNRRNIKIEEKY